MSVFEKENNNLFKNFNVIAIGFNNLISALVINVFLSIFLTQRKNEERGKGNAFRHMRVFTGTVSRMFTFKFLLL